MSRVTSPSYNPAFAKVFQDHYLLHSIHIPLVRALNKLARAPRRPSPGPNCHPIYGRPLTPTPSPSAASIIGDDNDDDNGRQSFACAPSPIRALPYIHSPAAAALSPLPSAGSNPSLPSSISSSSNTGQTKPVRARQKPRQQPKTQRTLRPSKSPIGHTTTPSSTHPMVTRGRRKSKLAHRREKLWALDMSGKPVILP